VLGAYQRGFRVIMATDALGTDDVDFANMNLTWLGARAARLLDNDAILTSVI
jgi:isochorismate hydrolase